MDKKKNDIKGLGGYLAIPFVMAVPVGVGYFFGAWLDHFFGTKPYLSFIFLFLGCVAGAMEFYRIVKRVSRDD